MVHKKSKKKQAGGGRITMGYVVNRVENANYVESYGVVRLTKVKAKWS
jgi:xanthine/uracil permease